MSASNAFHLSTTAAETYENQMVPSVFRPLAEATLDAISRPIGSRLIDIACGTGIIPKLLVERLSVCRVMYELLQTSESDHNM